MLKPGLVPSPLIPTEDKPVIGTSRQSRARDFRLLYVISHLTSLAFRMARLKVTGKLAAHQMGVMLAGFFSQMGVLWIKVGQLLSMRADLFSSEICDELAQLQDFGEGFPFEVAKSLIEHELGGPLDLYFSEFAEVPCATASIAQVHKARLKHEDVSVAVKVQMPDAAATFAKDMVLVRFFIWLLVKLSIKPHVRWQEMLWEIDQMIREELDFRFEAANMRRMRKTLRKHRVFVPKLFSQYTTPRVLVMEYVSGVLMTDYIRVSASDPRKLADWLQANNINPEMVARRLLFSSLRQSLEDNLFHGDLHPGNVMLLRDSQIAIIDFGSAGFLERELLRNYDRYVEAMINKQFLKMADIYLLCAGRLPPYNLAEAREQFVRSMESWERRTHVRNLPYGEKSVGAANEELIRIMGRYGISPVWGFLRETRALYTLDVSLRILAPETDCIKMVADYYRGREIRLRKKLASAPWAGTYASARFILELPVIASEYAMHRGAVVRRMARVFEGASNRIALFVAGVFGHIRIALVLAGLWLLGAFFQQRLGISMGLAEIFSAVPSLDIQIWIVIAATLFYSFRVLTKLKKEFSKEDIWEHSL